MSYAFLLKTGKILLLSASVGLLSACVTVPDEVQLISQSSQMPSVGQCRIADPDDQLQLQGDPLNGNGFVLTSWNIYKQKTAGWAEDFRQLAAQSDVLLLQEARLNDDLKDVLATQSLFWDLNPAFRQRQGYAGVMTAARMPAQKACAEQIIEPWLRLPKTAIVSYYPVVGHSESVLVVNIHGVNFTLDEVQLGRQLQQLGGYIREHQGPVVVAGDFNTWSRRRLHAVQAFAAEMGLRQIEFASGQPAQHFGHSVDHIYIRGLNPLKSEIKVVDSSDHYPLMVTLALEVDNNG